MKEVAQYTSRLPSPNFKRLGGPLGAGIPPDTSTSSNTTVDKNMLLENVDRDTTIQQLREQLDEASFRDKSAKTALSKSDSVILELRSNQRQLKRQLDHLHQERTEMSKELHMTKVGVNRKEESSLLNNQKSNRAESCEQIGELQVQLDRAHAQILTSDMVRKELEDTLEAEQYTWELRVQDQERQIGRLQQDCDTLVRDLDQCRSQWKEAEDGWIEELDELKEELFRSRSQSQQYKNDKTTNDVTQQDLLQKVHKLESERAELQSCLDEALLELEAVDAELQSEGGDNGEKFKNKNLARSEPFDDEIKSGDPDKITESLKHLLRWVYQEGPVEKRIEHNHTTSLRNDPQELVFLVQEALEGWLEATEPTANDKRGKSGDEHQATISDLTNQITLYEEELKSREESFVELRESLKEAVALLKPLQDAVAQTEEEKAAMKRQLRDRETDRQSSQVEISQQSHQICSLQDQISTLEKQLEGRKRVGIDSDLNRSAESTSITNQSSFAFTDEDQSLASIKRAREELRRKRETEGNLQMLLQDAQSRFQNIQGQNNEGQQQHAGEQYKQDAAVLVERDKELKCLQLELEQIHKQLENQTKSSSNESDQKISSLIKELAGVRGEMIQQEQTNNILNKSLKEALGLLKPLQMHLEEAEIEHTEISKELRNLRKRFRKLQCGDTDDISKSTTEGADVSLELIKSKDDLEEIVRQLELENSQLHDALEDLTDDDNRHNEAKMRQRLVELNSRYEVTQNKLEDAHVENHALVKALKQNEMNDIYRKEETKRLQENLQKTESELNSAKRITQSALVKVEELTMSNIEQLSISIDASTVDGIDNNNKN